MNSLLKKISTCVRWKVGTLSWKCKFGGRQFLYNFDLGLRGGHMEQGGRVTMSPWQFTLKKVS
jgi:hypothetical protein